jgi:DNA-binding response OmpR family regulator
MYTIGVLSTTTDFQSPYITELQKNGYHLVPLDYSDLLNQLVDIDAVVILYSTDNAVMAEQLYKAILTIKQQTELFVWMLIKESTKIDRLIFAQLGAGLVFDQKIAPDEFTIYLTNFLNYRIKAITGFNKNNLLNSSRALVLDKRNLSVILNGEKIIYLTKIEYKLLNYLIQKKDHLATYQEIADVIWPNLPDLTHQQVRIANTIFRLRKKIEKDPAHPQYIKTIRSVGYCIAYEADLY